MRRSIQITDPGTIRIVEAEQARRGDRIATRTAGNLILERVTLLEQLRQRALDADPSNMPHDLPVGQPESEK